MCFNTEIQKITLTSLNMFALQLLDLSSGHNCKYVLFGLAGVLPFLPLHTPFGAATADSVSVYCLLWPPIASQTDPFAVCGTCYSSQIRPYPQSW